MKRPKYIAVAAITLDGKIAKNSRSGSGWTSKEDKDFLHKFLDKCGLVIVGNNTYKLAKKALSRRNCLVFTSKVKKYKQINDQLAYCNPKNITPPFPSPSLQFGGQARGGKKRRDFLPPEWGRLGGGFKICVLGGSQVYSWFLQHKLLDEIYLTIEPKILGQGIPLFDTTIKNMRSFKLVSMKKLNQEGAVLLHYVKTSNR